MRAKGAAADAPGQASLHAAAARVFVHDAAARVEASLERALAATYGGEDLVKRIAELRAGMPAAPLNTVPLRRLLADETVARKGYLFGA